MYEILSATTGEVLEEDICGCLFIAVLSLSAVQIPAGPYHGPGHRGGGVAIWD